MKTIPLIYLAAVVLLSFAGCKSAPKHEPAITTTTTTEERIVRTPVRASTTTETQTIRSY